MVAVICFSPNWIRHIYIVLYSILKNSNIKKVYLLSEGLRSDDIQNLKNRYFGLEVVYVDCTDISNQYLVNCINTDNRFTKYTYYRLLIPQIISEEKVIYIDADALILDDLSEIYNLDMDNFILAGCVDTGLQPNYKSQIGMIESDLYFNAGILVMNNKKIKEFNLFDEWIKLFQTQYFLGCDQDILNLTCKQKIEISYIYNVSLSTNYACQEKDIKVIHYAGVKTKDTWVKGLPFDYIWERYEKEYVSIFGSLDNEFLCN